MADKRIRLTLLGLLLAGGAGVTLIAHAVTARPPIVSVPDVDEVSAFRLAAFVPDTHAQGRTVAASWDKTQSLDKLLVRAGVSAADRSAILAMDTVRTLEPTGQAALSLSFGAAPDAATPAALIALDIREGGRSRLTLARSGGSLKPVFATATAPTEGTAPSGREQLTRIQGLAGDDIARSLARAGVGAQAARDYGALVMRHGATRLPATAVYDIVIDRAAGPAEARLVYAGLIPAHGPELRLVRLDHQGKTSWHRAGEAAAITAVRLSATGWQRPVDSGRMSSSFGWRLHPILRFLKIHSGVDYAAPRGTPVRAAQAGTVDWAANRGAYGKLVEIGHGSRLATRYAHLDDFAVSPGQAVQRGDVIGYVGSTGLSTGPHLHFELLDHGRKVDPATARIAFSGSGAIDVTQQVERRYRMLTAMRPAPPG